jgi:hypothetical protein
MQALRIAALRKTPGPNMVTVHDSGLPPGADDGNISRNPSRLFGEIPVLKLLDRDNYNACQKG